jgi:alpha-2-macroglobulin
MRTTRSRALLGGSSLVIVLLGLGMAAPQRRPPAPPRPSPSATPVPRPAEATWAEADRLVSEQKYEAAAAVVAQIRIRAQTRGDEDEWTRALVREAQLRSALHGYETVVRFLRETPWPPGPAGQAVLDLFYGQTLVHYLQAYSWEIRQRERVESKDPLDLKKWTVDEIGTEAMRAYARVWSQRDRMGAGPIDRIGDYLQRGNYPARVRGTVRDTVSYLIVELLADTALWSPPQHEVYRLDVATLIAAAQASLDDPATHPLTKLAAVLTDLEAWHGAAGRREAAFEARLERLRRLHASLTAAEDRKQIRDDLEKRLPAMRDLEWWAVGQATLADFVREEDTGDALVRARAIALAGAEAYPQSIGGRQCRAIVAAIEAPAYQLTSMNLDGPARRSIEVGHANLPRLFFRAYAVDLVDRLRTSRDYNLLPAWPEVPKLVDGARAAAEWTSDLAPTPDYRQHRTFVTPPLSRPGLYVVVGSARADFKRESGSNHLQAVNLLVSDLVLVQRSTGDAIEVVATSGRTGEPVAGTRVELWQLDWQKGHHAVATRTAAADGTARFDLKGPAAVVSTQDWRSHQLALLARHGEDLSLAAQVPWAITLPRQVRHASLVYTDRSVYRPQQKILWKVIAYEGGGDDQLRFHTSPGTSLNVELVDANGQVVEKVPVVTNDYGSVAGEFTIPAGRLLGSWRVRSSRAGETAVRVEEYKRPTFEVALLDPEQEIRLNRPATLRGDVRYYFGLPVTTGKVSWRVTRQAVQPWWWWLWGGSFDAATRVVAAGEASLGPDGRFNLSFTPEADARASRELTWTYAVEADVTDEGGETRSATRRFRLGLVSVEARLTDLPGFFLENRAAPLPIVRSDLDGTPRAGAAAWRLVSLHQPARTLLPAEQPLPAERTESTPRHRTPGDDLRPRSDPQYTPPQVLRLWTEGSALARGAVTHDAKGEAVVSLPPLPAGAYRLHYETKDAAGATFHLTQEIVVAQPRDTPLALPGLLAVERASVPVGGIARLFVHSGLPGQPMTVEFWQSGRRTDVRHLVSGRGPDVLELPISAKDRGGFGVTLTLVRDHQLVHQTASVFVPWDDRALGVAFSTFRDKLRPGDRETWRITVTGKDPRQEATAAVEVLAAMYDRSLDLFAPHVPADALSLYPNRTAVAGVYANLGGAGAVWSDGQFAPEVVRESLLPDRLDFWSGYAIGGPGRRRMMLKRVEGDVAGGLAETVVVEAAPAPPASVAASVAVDKMATLQSLGYVGNREETKAPAPPPPATVPLRSDFSETAFWQPQLLTGPDGTASFEFTVPDSVTSWNVWAAAITRDLRAGAVRAQTRSVKELMVRPYLPRFLREGDRAEIKVVVNNASDGPLSGDVAFEIEDPDTHESLLSEFGVDRARALTFAAPASGSASVTVPLVAPRRLGAVAIKVVARAGDHSDGEQRALPVLPSRLHLVESRFVTVKGATSRTLTFPALAQADPTRQTEQLVVTLDAQLFYGVLQALPYLVNYPYECTEQTLNRFVSTGILSSLFGRYPAIAKMAAEMAKRDTRLEPWDRDDPNRRMQLEETPWVVASKGGKEKPEDLVKVLDPRIAKATREEALAKLAKAQTSLGAFPWWPGGPPSPYMTLYTVYGMSKAREFGVDVPKDMVKKAFAYLHRHYLDEWIRDSVKCDCGWEFVTFLGYVLTSYPDDSWTGGVFTAAERQQMLDFSFRHWKEHSPYLKGYLALTLQRRGRPADARLVWDSVMDSAKTDADTGTSWAPEDRAWLWYNDTIETHAFALRTLAELAPRDPRREGLVQWLFLHKKLNHWSSTRSTAEVLYSLAHYLKQENQLGVRENATVRVGTETRSFVFEPDAYTGKATQVVIPGPRVDAERASAVVVEKTTPGMMFASATWHYATDRLPSDEAGDLFTVSRRYFRRENRAGTWTLVPIAEGAALATGDEVEVQLSLRAKQAAEYVHLRDPRGAGFEPVTLVSGFKWQTGLGLYEEVRDSGENFFFEWLPAGEYTFRYRIRAATAGRFRVGPAEVQSMYAPEFAARSAGAVLEVGGSGR